MTKHKTGTCEERLELLAIATTAGRRRPATSSPPSIKTPPGVQYMSNRCHRSR